MFIYNSCYSLGWVNTNVPLHLNDTSLQRKQFLCDCVGLSVECAYLPLQALRLLLLCLSGPFHVGAHASLVVLHGLLGVSDLHVEDGVECLLLAPDYRHLRPVILDLRQDVRELVL